MRCPIQALILNCSFPACIINTTFVGEFHSCPVSGTTVHTGTGASKYTYRSTLLNLNPKQINNPLMILDETYSLLRTRYKEQTGKLTITAVRIGVHLTAVKLSDESVGFAGTLSDNCLPGIRKDRDYGDFTPAQIQGKKITDLFDTPKRSCIIDTLRIAVMNAISSGILSSGGYKIIEDKDPIELVDLTPPKTITIVGAFQSYIHTISDTGNRLHVLEFDENTLYAEHRKHFVPASQYREVIPSSDIVIITGLTLVNNTIDGLLSAISPGTTLIVTGPSSSLIPDVLFRNHVNIVGATRITNPDLLFDIVSESGAGYHLFKYCARKICILNE